MRASPASFVSVLLVAAAAAACHGDDTPGKGGDSGLPPAPADAAPPAPPDAPAPFDTSVLVVADDAADACRLSADREALLLRVRNDGTEAVPSVTVEIASDGTPYRARATLEALAPATTAELRFERGPVAGFADPWAYTITVDPDALHGPARTLRTGSCTSLRARASAAARVLRHFYDVEAGLYEGNAWWTGANMLEAAIDHARETGDAAYLDVVDNTFVKSADGVPDISAGNFLNDFYDDEGWWGLAWVKAYDLTHDPRYLDMARTIFADITHAWSDECGGGLFWNHERHYKNAITNELFLTLAARLHARTPGDAGAGSYLDWAQREWAWFRASGMIQTNGSIVDGLTTAPACGASGPAYTYNQGVILGGLAALWRASHDDTLLDAADAIAGRALAAMTAHEGVFVEAVCDADLTCGEGDGVQFKGVFARNLALLDEVRPRAAYRAFLVRQSDALWHQARSAADELGKYWQGPFDRADASRQSSGLDALTGAVRAAEPDLALGGAASGSAACTAAESAANAIDGNGLRGSKWCSGGASGQELVVDLGRTRRIVGFRVRHAGAGGEDPGWNTRDFELATSADAQTWTTAVTVTGNTASVTSHFVPRVSARYVRLHVTRAQTSEDFAAARIYELEVLGTSKE
jgi:predicted alpha-1,6-mannanase (GH76 family)